jgi:hypothetical protein
MVMDIAASTDSEQSEKRILIIQEIIGYCILPRPELCLLGNGCAIQVLGYFNATTRAYHTVACHCQPYSNPGGDESLAIALDSL